MAEAIRSQPRVLRATSTIARSLYRELRRADYSPQDVLRLVNEMMELITADARNHAEPRVQPIVDRETGLPNAAVMGEVLDFELAHAREGHDLLVIALDVELPDVCADAVCTAVHEAVSSELRRQLRAAETVGRIAPARYLIVVPRATLDVATPLLRRLSVALGRLDAVRLPQRARIVAHAAAYDSSIASAAELLERCFNAPSMPVHPPPIAAGTGQVRIVGQRRVVLALGGGAARAMAHLGALRVF